MHEIVSFSKEIEFKNMIHKITSISLEHTLMLDSGSNVKGDFIISGTYKMTAASQIENDFSYKIPVDIEVDDRYDLSNLVIDIDDFTYEVIDEEILKVNIDLLLDKLEVKEKQPVLEEVREALAKDELVSKEDLFMEVDDKIDLSIPEIELLKEDPVREEKTTFEDSEKEVLEMAEENEKGRDEMFEQTKESDDVIVDTIDNVISGKQVVKIPEVTKEPSVVNESLPKETIDTSVLEDTETNDAPSLFASFDSSQETYATYRIYIMRDGDSIEEIIKKYNTTRDMIEEYNDLSDLRIGTKIIIPNTKNE